MDVKGIVTNVVLLKQIVKSQAFADGHLTTGFLDVLPTQTVLEIVEGGMQTTVQDFPGRVGLWNVGVPPSGPMDNYAHRLANRLVGNDSSAAALEITTLGPVIRFHSDAFIALTGAPATAVLKTNNAPVPFWRAVSVAKGDELRIAELKDGGCRCYLAVRGGFDLPLYLGSRSTFPRGAVGPMPRALEAGDLLAVAPEPATGVEQIHSNILVPRYGSEWTVRVLPGPHEAPDFFTEGDVEKFYATEWKVHYNSNRLGIRLDGPTDWQWARTDGGEGGSHPSNVHDCVYAIGSINFTGDKPVIITQDGPSLGGFVCIATVITADMWMLGQLTPGDTLRFVRVALPQAIKVWRRQDLEISSLDSFAANADSTEAGQELAMREPSFERAVVARLDGSDSRPSVVYRMAGDCYVLIEYGDMVLDFASRFRVHALQLALEAAGIDGLLECSPGVRSLQIKYDGLRLPLSRLLSILAAVETSLVSIESVTTRVLHLPLAFDDRWCKEAVAKYMASIRSSGPWLPSNVDFVARCNGVSERDVRESVLGTDFMVLGLGDVYLGAPCAVAMDPLKRMVVPKYNPARTYTPEGAVGLGGAYMCIYPMASPGGYQLVGRTLPIWNGLQTTADFVNSPWLLRNFDRVRFHLVSEEDLKTARHAFKRGTYEMRVTEEDFSLRKYQELLDSNSDAIAAFNRSQTKAAKLATIGY